MTQYLDTPLFGVAITIIAYSVSQYINKRFKTSILNPIALSIMAIVGFLIYNNIDYEVYNKGGNIIGFFLGPATVALAVPLYKKIELLKENLLPILVGIFVGSLAGIVSVILLSRVFKLEDILMLSLIPKSTTSAIAMDISTQIGGNSAIAIVFVIVTGIFGNILGPDLLRRFGIKDEIAKGISMGTASHVVGTAKAMEMGEKEGAMSSLAIGVAGLMTVFLAPLVLKFMDLL
ncbi:LrgB family protein [Tissierellaceae bacterium HCP3S3_D8]